VRLTALAALVAIGALLGGCSGNAATLAPGPGSAGEREWVANASQLVDALESDLLATGTGGSNLATARRALASQSDLYTMVVAYSQFGDCTHELANVGTPSRRAEMAAQAIAGACRKLSHAAALFHRAASQDDPAALIAATRGAVAAEPLLLSARADLAALA
jgi:hypothetical protein